MRRCQTATSRRARAVRLLATESPAADARLIEESVFAWAPTAAAYEDKITHLAAALRLNGHHLLAAHAPHRLVGLPDDALAEGTPIAAYAALQKERERKQAALLQEDVPVSADSEFIVCGKCKQSQILVEQKQTRGADEGMTVYCKCLNCNHKWRM